MSEQPNLFPGRSADPRGYFSDVADIYDRHRPRYPGEAIEAILSGLGSQPTIADIGCGTGIFARQLAEHGATVQAVDPNEAMLDIARAAPKPRAEPIEYRRGTAEDTGLERETVDCVACAQAYHWFNPSRALPELARILRPAGRLALIWNRADHNDPVAAEYDRIAQRARDAASEAGRSLRAHRSRDPSEGGWFTDVQELHFSNPQTYDLDALLGRARSASYFPTTGPLRDELERALRELFERHQHNGGLTMTLDTLLIFAKRSH